MEKTSPETACGPAKKARKPCNIRAWALPRVVGKDEVPGSNPGNSSKNVRFPRKSDIFSHFYGLNLSDETGANPPTQTQTHKRTGAERSADETG